MQAMARLEQEDYLIRKQTLQLGRLIIDFNAERGNQTVMCRIINVVYKLLITYGSLHDNFCTGWIRTGVLVAKTPVRIQPEQK